MSTNEDNIDMDYLISLIRERDILWDKSHVDFKNKNLKAKSWEQISKTLFPDYDNFTPNKKNKIDNDIVKKWRSVKDNFYKYLKKSKETKIKKYHYYNQLLFLIKEAPDDTGSGLTTETITESTNDIVLESSNDTVPESSRYIPMARKRALEEPENRHMSFFKGILPSVQDFTDFQTLTFQSKVLQIITEIRYGQMYQDQESSSHGFEQMSPSYSYNKLPKREPL